MKKKMLATGSRGFSLVELMIAVLIFGVVLAGSYAMYYAQQRTYLLQDQLVEMQQNVRSFLFYIEKDLRMAGYDPLKAGIKGFLIANPTEVVVSADIGTPRTAPVNCTGAGCDNMPDGSIITAPCTGCVVETVRYALNSTPTPQANGQVAIATITSVVKTFNGTTGTDAANPPQVVVEYVQALEFLYNLSDGTSVTAVPTAAGRDTIRSVTVSVLMRMRNPTRGYQTPTSCAKGGCFYPASNADKAGAKVWGPFSDSYRRRLVVTNIQCRNMALQAVTD